MPRKSFDASVLGEFFGTRPTCCRSWAATARGRSSTRVARAHGWSLEDLQSSPFIDLVHPDDVAATVREFDRMVAAPDATLIEFRNRNVTETERTDGSSGVVRAQRHVFSAGATSRAKSKDRWSCGQSRDTRAILDAVVDSIITIDEQFRVLDVSPGTDRIYGVSHDERRGTNSLNIVLPMTAITSQRIATSLPR